MKGIRIVSKIDGFRRAGISHTGSKDYPLTDFTAAQLKQLEGESNLVVIGIDMAEGAEAEGADAGKQPSRGKAGTGKPPAQ